MDAYELRRDIAELEQIKATLSRAAEQDRPLTHSLRTVLIRATLILIEDIKARKQTDLSATTRTTAGIPF